MRYFHVCVVRGLLTYYGIFRLVQNISSLVQEILKLENPIGDILTTVDLSPVSTILCQNNPVLMARQFEAQKMFVRELHRQTTFRASCEKIVLLINECQNFVKGTEVRIPINVIGIGFEWFLFQ